jgi:CRISPR-associated protein Cmr2
LDDLQLVAEGLKAMFLTYGFSAKRTSGYGVAKDEIVGLVKTGAGEKKLTRLSQVAQEVKNVNI